MENNAPKGIHWVGIAGLACFMILVSSLISWVSWNPTPQIHPVIQQISVGWMDMFPYQTSQLEQGYLHRDGLGLRVLERTLDGVGCNPEFRDAAWSTNLEALKRGDLTAMPMAAKNPEREEFAYFSEPYLQFQIGAFSCQPIGPSRANLNNLYYLISSKKMRLSATRGFAYPDKLQQILDQARQDKRLVEVVNDYENLQLLADGSVELAFVDELVGFSVIQNRHWENVIAYQPLELPPIPLSVMFSKRAVTVQFVEEFNRSLQEVKDNGQYARLLRSYHFPRLLFGFTSNNGFRIWATSGAMFAGLTGLLIARKERYGLIGALALASCPAVGGGILRDVVAGRHPLSVVADPVNLIAIAILVGAGWLFFRIAPLSWREELEGLDPSNDRRIQIFDSVGLGVYTVLGVFIAMESNLEPLWLWGPLLAVVQNGGGGILRDLLAGRGGQISILKGAIFGEITAFWGLALAIFLVLYSASPQADLRLVGAACGLTMVGAVATRCVILWRGWLSPAY